MLSLTKINSSRNQARSARSGDGYLFYIRARSTRERSDFASYLRGPEAAGQPAPFWAGDGARLLGLGDTPEPVHVERLAHGFHPLTGAPLVQGAGDKHVMGLDMTFSAPKDVSAVFAAADARTQLGIIAAMKQAVLSALRYAEAGALTRHGHGGHVQRQADATLAVCHTHFASRCLEPQLHVHGFWLNVGKRQGSNEWSALELSAQFDRKLATGAVFRSELAWRMRELGFAVVRDGPYFKLDGVSDAQRDALSTRSKQIRERANQQAASGNAQKDRDVAALNTRAGKAEPPLPELLSSFREQAARVGLDAAAVARMRAAPAPERSSAAAHPPTPGASAAIAATPGAQAPFAPAKSQGDARADDKEPFAPDHARLVEALTTGAGRSCFTPQEALVEICSKAMGQWPASECIAELDRFLGSKHVVRLGASERNMPVFSSRATQELEARTTQQVARGAADVRHRVDAKIVDGRFDALERELSEKVGARISLAQQRAAALHVACQTGDHAFVEGWAGAGKTTLLKALGEAYAEAGFTLVGCAQSAAAAQNLSRETGIRSRTIASLLLALRNGRAKLGERVVLVLDEAGMVGSREFALLQEAAIDARAKFVSVGDSKQLQPVAAGGIFRALVREHGAAEVSAIQRQKTDFRPLFEWLDKQAEKGAGITPGQARAVRELPENERLAAAAAICGGERKLRLAFERWRARFDHQWLRLAVEQFATGAALPALRLLDSRGRLMLLDSPESAIEATVDAWAADKTPLASKTMIAGTRAEVAELNARARERLVELGVVLDRSGAEIGVVDRDGATEPKRFAPGERIVFTKNDRELGVANGVSGVILEMANDAKGDLALVVELDAPNARDELRVVVPASFGRFDHAYCLTNHRSQGRTFDSAYVLVNPIMADREWAYVAASRSRFATTLFVDASTVGMADPESHLASHEPLTREQKLEALARGMSRSHAKGTTLDYRTDELVCDAAREPFADRDPRGPCGAPAEAAARAPDGSRRRAATERDRRDARSDRAGAPSDADRRASAALRKALSREAKSNANEQERRR
ncbi:relaxase domain-containing protein [Burkholderia thailandensis]|uniref:MobF family relaxase n=1 Tax=Burkholderia thailandensis TaxID=57975 RepID=UPI00217EC6B8|nr:MobF family relaxase [Burkholderia thailandensis]MCS6473777.1 relaxase domain-containing protein [Burkholderia thailandensis]